MKKILFLTYKYPYGVYMASSACSTKIMLEMANDEDIEVHCVSYEGHGCSSPSYQLNNKIHLHTIPTYGHVPTSTIGFCLQFLLHLPVYPISSFKQIIKHYRICKKLCKATKFDLVVTQCYDENSALVGSLLKKHGHIDNLAILYWDNLYGKNPPRFVPLRWGKRRLRLMESFLAKYANALVSLYPIKKYHEEHGDVKNAIGKRYYLGIPLINSPAEPVETQYLSVIKMNMINIVYSGSIVRKEYLSYSIDIFNRADIAENINLIFFSNSLTKEQIGELRQQFRGTIQVPGYIPNRELLTVYRSVDMFISFPGDTYSIRSKCYEYMSYGHPMILFYDHVYDVNVATFSKYPLTLCLNVKDEASDNAHRIESFWQTNKEKHVSFETVDALFPLDTTRAYSNLLKAMIAQ